MTSIRLGGMTVDSEGEGPPIIRGDVLVLACNVARTLRLRPARSRLV